MDQDRGFSVLLEHRPRCVAFLVDIASATDDLLDAIVDFNLGCWGGRYNPIIPTQNQKICPDYWRLLRLSDPDLIYSYSELGQETIERLDFECGPIHVVRNGSPPSADRRDFIPSSLRDQASIKGLILQFGELIPGVFRKPKEPSILAFDIEHNNDRLVSSFVRRNFGVSRDAYFAARDDEVNATFPASFSDIDVLECVEKTMNLLLPINLCAKDARRKRAITTGREESFVIAYGEHVANAIYYWNRAYFRGIPNFWTSGIDDMWLGSSAISDPMFYQALLKVIRRRVFMSGQRELKIISCDHETAELNELAKKISFDVRTNLYPGNSEKFSPDFFPECSAERPLEFIRPRPNHEFVKGKRFFINVSRPESLSAERDQRWMLRLYIEDPEKEKVFLNMEPWWRLPQRQGLARLFAGRHRRSRIGMEGELVVEVGSGEENCEITIPEKHAIFSTLLLPEMQYWTTDDLRHGLSNKGPRKAIATSEKGKYLNGLFSLFGSMSEATYFFEHPFWSQVLIGLCRPEVSQPVKEMVKAKIAKQGSAFVQDFQADREAAIEWFAEEMIQVGQKIPRAENVLHFENLVADHGKFVAAQTSDRERQQATRMDLKEDLSRLSQTGVLLQGFEISCQHCKSKFWYHVDDVKTVVVCMGCRQPIPLPVEKPWSYKPNELLWKGVRYQGLVPVMRTVRRLFDETEVSFIFASGIVLYEYQKDPPVLTGEVDLAWIRDGRFGFAEVKQSADLFKTKDCDRLVAIARIARPNAVVLAAMTGEDARMTKWHQLVDAALSPLGVTVETWGPSAFSKPSHHVW